MGVLCIVCCGVTNSFYFSCLLCWRDGGLVVLISCALLFFVFLSFLFSFVHLRACVDKGKQWERTVRLSSSWRRRRKRQW